MKKPLAAGYKTHRVLLFPGKNEIYYFKIFVRKNSVMVINQTVPVLIFQRGGMLVCSQGNIPGTFTWSSLIVSLV